ncbi:hypothetical protein GCM10027162_45450 [Streptomyces incanus]
MLLDRMAAGEPGTSHPAPHTVPLDEAPRSQEMFQGEGGRLRARRHPADGLSQEGAGTRPRLSCAQAGDSAPMTATPRRRRMQQSRVLWLLDRLERAPWADPVIDALRAGVRSLPLGRGRDVLHGRWLGHPAHPLMVQVPIGSWLSAAVLDTRSDRSREAGLLVGVGLAAAAPSALAGAVDWAELHREQARVGLVHAMANWAAVGLYATSLTCRLKGRTGPAGRTASWG